MSKGAGHDFFFCVLVHSGLCAGQKHAPLVNRNAPNEVSCSEGILGDLERPNFLGEFG